MRAHGSRSTSPTTSPARRSPSDSNASSGVSPDRGPGTRDRKLARNREAPMKLGITILRVAVGGAFVAHGTQKLFGWFGGGGPSDTAAMFDKIGLRPGKRNALIAGASEAGGGALLAAGLLTPVAGTLITGVMSQAIRSL